MKLKLFILFLSISLSVIAQKKVTFILENTDEEIFLASNLSQWQPSNALYKFAKQKGRNQLVLNVDSGTKIQYKITRGSWEKVETKANGISISNRELWVKNDTTVYIKVLGWADKVLKKPFESKQLVADSLYSKILKKKKAYWVYLPKDYKKSRKYPVIYLQDGQNLFDGYYTHNGQEWEVDESLDSLQKIKKPQYIVVGIGSDADRLQEYSPYPWKDKREIKGEAYLQFMVKELIPYIDSHYSTNSIRSIGGSSMGALISLEAILKYPHIFKNAALFSMAQANELPDNAFVLKQVQASLKDHKTRNVFIYYGKEESKTLTKFSNELYQAFKSENKNRVRLNWNDFGKHKERYWKDPFVSFLKFTYNSKE